MSLMLFTCRTPLAAFLTLVALLAPSAPSVHGAPVAQSLAKETGAEESPAQWLEDFMHYTTIAKPDLASAFGQKLLDSGLSSAEMADLVDGDDRIAQAFDAAVLRAVLIPELEPVAAELNRRVEEGRRDLSRDAERIEKSIAMLTGTQRQKALARERLLAAGEYAVPALLEVVTDGKDERLQRSCRDVIAEIKARAVNPLCAALPNVDPTSQVLLCDLLGEIHRVHAAPALLELALSEKADDTVREAARRAFRAVEGPTEDLSRLYVEIGHRYFLGQSALIAYPQEPTNNVWAYDPFVGLVGTPVPTAIYSEVMAMRMAARALELDRENTGALTLFVAANLKRENDLPEGDSDPVFGEAKYTPAFYATVFGTQVCLDVLSLALDTNDTPLVRDAIKALSETTGGSNLFATGDERRSLVEALSYPDRRVQYEAALTLARALPNEPFPGDSRVIPLLASAVRSGGEAFALVVADDDETRREEVSRLEKLGYSIGGAERTVAALAPSIDLTAGIDLIVVRMTEPEAAKRAIDDLRRGERTAAAPILVLVAGIDLEATKLEYLGVPSVLAMRAFVDEESTAAGIDDLLRLTTGGRMTEVESEAYAIEALGALRDVAIARTTSFSIADAEISLLDALGRRTGGTRLMVADTLALIQSDAAQRALFDAALAATGGERVDLLDRVAQSVKRFGDRAEKRHIAALVDLVEESEGATAEAAAHVHGALNLPSGEAVRLITPVTP